LVDDQKRNSWGKVPGEQKIISWEEGNGGRESKQPPKGRGKKKKKKPKAKFLGQEPKIPPPPNPPHPPALGVLGKKGIQTENEKETKTNRGGKKDP